MTAPVGASTTSQTSAPKILVGKVVTTSASIVQPSAPLTSSNSVTGVSKSYVDDQIQALRNSISSDVFKNSSYLYPANAGLSQAAINAAISQRIDQLNNVTITNTTVHGVSGLTAADIPTGITASNYLPLAGGSLSGNVTVSGTASTSNLVVSSAFSFGALTGILKSVSGVVSATLVNLASDVTGILPIANGGTGTSTVPTYGKLLLGNASGGYDLAATSTLGITAGGSGSVGAGTAGQFPYFAGSGTTVTATSSLFLSTAGNIGLGTTSPFARLSIAGAAGGTSNLFAVSTTTAGFATSTALRISQNGNLHLMNGAGIDIGNGVTPPPNGLIVAGIASTSNLVASNSFTFGTLSGVLKSVAGVVSATLVNLASDVTGILPIVNGGTGTSTAPTYGKVLVGNASGGYDLTATSSLGIAGTGGATLGANTFTGAQTITAPSSAAILQTWIDSGQSANLTAGFSTNTTSSGAKELIFSQNVGANTANVIGVRNTASNGYSAIVYRDYLNAEHGAFGYGNPTSGGAFASKMYIEASNLDGVSAPASFAIAQTGVISNYGAGSNTYTRALFDGSSGDITFYGGATGTSQNLLLSHAFGATLNGTLAGLPQNNTSAFTTSNTWSGSNAGSAVSISNTWTTTGQMYGLNVSVGTNSGPAAGGSAAIKTSGLLGNWFDVGSGLTNNTALGLQIATKGVGLFTPGSDPTDAKRTVYLYAGTGTANSPSIITMRSYNSTGGGGQFMDMVMDYNTATFWFQFANSVANPLSLKGNSITVAPLTAIPAGGTAGVGSLFSSTANFGTFFGSGAPTLSAAQGSLYLRSDGSPYFNNNNSTGWTQLATLGANTFTGTQTITGGLTVSGGATTTGPAYFANNVGIGTTSPWAQFSVAGASLGTTPLFAIATSTASATSTAVIVDSNGKVGIGTTSPSTQLQVSGVVTPNADNTFSLGNATYRWSAVFAANGTIQTSDARLKNNVNNINYDLSDLMKLRPVSFTWIAQPGQGTQLGFIAQEVRPLFPEVVNVGDDANHTLGITYTEFIPVIVKSIQDIANISGVFKDNIVAWLGSASNGIGDLFANRVIGNQLCAKKSDGGLVCVTGDQLASVISGAAQSSGGSSSSGASDTTPPVITITGGNPAHLHIGDVYSDLGATVTDNVDQNIGVHAFVGSVPLDQAIIDTSTSTTYYIDYVATDSAGNTATSTRRVIVGN
jgi:hypothetical protein